MKKKSDNYFELIQTFNITQLELGRATKATKLKAAQKAVKQLMGKVARGMTKQFRADLKKKGIILPRGVKLVWGGGEEHDKNKK